MSMTRNTYGSRHVVDVQGRRRHDDIEQTRDLVQPLDIMRKPSDQPTGGEEWLHIRFHQMSMKFRVGSFYDDENNLHKLTN